MKLALIVVGIVAIGVATINVLGAEMWDLADQMQRWWE